MLDLHELIAEGKNESREADEVREDLDEIWDHLTEQERELDGALSENLYHLFTPDEELKKEPDPAQIFQKRNLFRALGENLSGARDPAERLKLFAKIPVNYRPDAMFYQKACLFHQLGIVEIAVRFMRRTVALSGDGSRGFMLLDWIRRAFGPEKAIQEFREILPLVTEHRELSELAYVMALIDLFDLEKTPKHLTEAAALTEPIFEKAVESQDFPEIMVNHSAMLLSSIFERKGEGNQAINVLRRAKKRVPLSQLVRVKLGVALYDQDTGEAIALFEGLIREQTRSIWPYLFLSHHYLKAGKWGEAGRVAVSGVALTDNPKIRADLLESCAISIAETGGDPNMVRDIFKEALLLDPGNKRIASNFKVLQKHAPNRIAAYLDISRRPGSMPDWQREEVGVN